MFIRQWHIVRDPTAMWRDIPGQLKEICRYAIRGNHAAKWQFRDTVYWGRTSIRDSIRFPMRLLKIHEPERWTLADMQKVSELWQESCGGKIAEKDIPDLARTMVAVEHIRDALGHASVHKILKYIGRRVEAERDRWEKEKSAYAGRRPESPGTYRDYLKDCVKLQWASRFPLWTAVVPACGARRTTRRLVVLPTPSICMGWRPTCTAQQVRRR